MSSAAARFAVTFAGAAFICLGLTAYLFFRFTA
jgi:hypothetical protein